MPTNVDAGEPAIVALDLSRRLMNVNKVKSILHIEAGIEMIALAMLISSEVCMMTYSNFSYFFSLSVRMGACFLNQLEMSPMC